MPESATDRLSGSIAAAINFIPDETSQVDMRPYLLHQIEHITSYVGPDDLETPELMAIAAVIAQAFSRWLADPVRCVGAPRRAHGLRVLPGGWT